jgi:hypothetical protein
MENRTTLTVSLTVLVILSLIAVPCTAEGKENAVLYKGERTVIHGEEIVLIDYTFTGGTYEVTLRIEGEEYLLREGDSLNRDYTITFLGKKEPPLLSFAFYISALPLFDELKEVILYEGKRAAVGGHEIIVESVDTAATTALIFFDGEESFLLKYGKLESETLDLWLYRTVIGLSGPYVVLKCRFFYADTEGDRFAEDILRVPSNEEPRCLVVVGARAADQDHITAAAVAEMLQCEVITDTEITEDHKRMNTLILVGGPRPPCGKSDPANLITSEITGRGIIPEEYWITGNGAQEGFRYLADPWGYGTDVIIVAGSDREATSLSGQYFIDVID